MSNTYDLYTTDFIISFALYNKVGEDWEIGDKKQIIIEDCYFEEQAEQKFWELTGFDYDGICLMDIEELELTTHKDLLLLEKSAMLEHLFGTTDFGQTDHAIKLKYSDYE